MPKEEARGRALAGGVCPSAFLGRTNMLEEAALGVILSIEFGIFLRIFLSCFTFPCTDR